MKNGFLCLVSKPKNDVVAMAVMVVVATVVVCGVDYGSNADLKNTFHM